MRYLPSGDPVTNFSVAVNRTYTHNNEQVKETVWFRIVAWGKQAESCNKYLKQGSKVLVEGRLNADKETGGPVVYTDKSNTPKSSFEVTAQTVRFLSSRSEPQQSEFGANDDVPF